MFSKNISNKSLMVTMVKMVISAGAFLFIIFKIIGQVNSGQWHDISSFRPGFLLLGVILVPVNWLFEALKWKILTRRFQQLSVLQSYKAVLNGLTVSMFTPNRIGEFAGRILNLNHDNRIKGISATLVNSQATMTIIFIFGFWALATNQNLPEPFGAITRNQQLVNVLGFLAIILVVVFFFSLPVIAQVIQLSKWPKVSQFIEAFRFYSFNELLLVFFLSAIRFLVFSLQFFLMLRFTVDSPDFWISYKAICLVYLFITIIPSFTLVELGIRSSLAVLFLTPIINQPIEIVEATIVLWLSNIAIPALVGTLTLYRTKVEL